MSRLANRSQRQPLIKPKIIVGEASVGKEGALDVERTDEFEGAKESSEEQLDSPSGQNQQYVPLTNGDVTSSCTTDDAFTMLNSPKDDIQPTGEMCLASQDKLVTTNSGTRVIENGIDVDAKLEDLIQKTHQKHQENTDNKSEGNDGIEEVKGQTNGLGEINGQPYEESEGYVSVRPDKEAGNIIPPKVSLLGRLIDTIFKNTF